ncbi:unnamed protein product [Rangifer tarandus platyrhynchus]|uniref:Uncharacterized protein n=1 Tax=Rangifer tarandus platyrhynchus TaxID=3082113 RepID=A0ABN8ZTT6_RANTA|nr:unnamed protein product [Rangifer tarandus platyrhynchus]
MEDTMGGVYWGPWAAIGCLGGCGADPLAGRLRWGGAEWPRRSQRERLRRGPGRAAGPLGGLGGSYLGLRRGGHRSPLLFGGSRLPASAPGSGRRRQQRPRPPRVGRFREGGPSCFRVRASGRRASPALSERLRPAWADTSPAAPAQHALHRRLNRCRRLCWCHRVPSQPRLSVLAGLSAGTANSRRVPVSSGPRAPDPAHAAPPRATPRLQTSRRARTYLPRPLQPAGSCPAPPPHVTLPASTTCACADTPHFNCLRRTRPVLLASGGPAQTFLPHFTAELGTSALD